MMNRAGENPHTLYCALEYRSLDREEKPPGNPSVIILIVRAEQGDLRLLVHPGWSRVVEPPDHDYIRAILSDFKRRAKFDPDGLMNQVSELSVGPLVTHAVGARLSEHPFLLYLGDSFVEPHLMELD